MGPTCIEKVYMTASKSIDYMRRYDMGKINSCVVRKNEGKKAVRAIHQEFELDKEENVET